MAAADKDLADLRKEHKDLSDHSGRLAIVFLTILTLFGISFSRAWNRVLSGGVEDLVCQIQVLNNDQGNRYLCQVEVSYIFGYYLDKYDATEERKNCKGPCIDLFRSLITSPSSLPQPPSSGGPPGSGPTPPASPARSEPTPSSPTPCACQKTDDACACQEKLQKELEDKAVSWFGTKPPIPGVDLTIDLRYWAFALPALFCLFGLYLYVLRKKQDLVWVIGNHRLREADAAEITRLDRLYFEGDAPYRSFPSKLTSLLVVVFYVFMPLYVGYRAWSSWDRGGEAILLLLPLFFFCGVPAIAYGRYVAGKLEEQIASITRVETRPKASRLKWLGQTLNPAIPLAVGSLLVLTTLHLSVIKPNWWSNDNKFEGSALLHRETKNLWVTVPTHLMETFRHSRRLLTFQSNFSWTIYVMALILAIVIILLLVPPVRSLLKRKWIRASTFALTTSILALVIIDLTIGVAFFFDVFSPIWLIKVKIAVSLAAVLWIWFAAWKTVGGRGSLWQKNTTTLLIVGTPLLLISLIFALWLRLPGLFALVVGTSLQVLGFIHLQYRSNLASEDLKS